MLYLTRRAVNSCTSEDTDYLRTKLTDVCDIYQLHPLWNIVPLQYLDIDSYITYRILNDIYLALSGLKLVSKVNGTLVSLTIGTLYSYSIEFLPLLSFDATNWSRHPCYNALSVELQETIRLDIYIYPIIPPSLLFFTKQSLYMYAGRKLLLFSSNLIKKRSRSWPCYNRLILATLLSIIFK